MISAFESMVRRYPQRTCFTYVDEAGEEAPYSYREVRMLAAALARHLQARGVQRGDCIAVDLPNCPLYVLLILAAAYGSFTIVAVNNRLTSNEKLSRLLELERCLGARIAVRVEERDAQRLLERAAALLAGEDRYDANAAHAARPSFTARAAAATAAPRSSRGLGRVTSNRAARRRRDETQRQDALEEIIHFAERSAHVFDAKTRALVMFTSGTTGKPKAVPLSWDQLCRAAEASNAALNSPGVGMWQAALPLYHIGGFQVIVRSLLGCVPFILYRRFDAARLLSDAARSHVTHVSVVDKMLQDLLNEDDAGTLKDYRCILLGGAASNPHTLARATAVGARVYASYGMTETSSQIAHAQVTASFDGGLRLLPGYEVRIVDPDAQGFGRLAVKGPGVFEGYLNARAAYTVDGFFLTGDTAALGAGRLYVKERTADMFVSGGENVYPAEIRDKLVRVPGVAEAYVFGAPDAVWGRRPVAFVERERAAGSPRSAIDTPQQFAATVRASLGTRLSKLYQPRCICVLDEFPRTGVGKIDRAALQALYEQRIEVVRVTLYRVRLPFTRPFKTAKGFLRDRESVIVEVEDHAGRVGLGECVAFSTDWYLPETLDQDVHAIESALAPLVLSEVYLHPSEVSASFASCAEAASLPLAQGALEPALWDLYGKIVGKPLWQLIGGTASRGPAAGQASVFAGAVVGMGTVSETVAAVHRSVEAGYRRVKLKVAPGGSLAAVQAVRAAYPQLMITLDANQSFAERDMDELRALDECGAAWIEEPLDPHRPPGVGPTDVFDRLARLQRSLSTPICLDESIARPHDLVRALQRPELRCYALKIAKMGGVQPSLDFLRLARSRGLAVWMGGMYDTGVSKRLHAAFETLEGIDAPGDIGATARYFFVDVTDPPHTAERGVVTLNRAGHAHGLGCDLNRASLAGVLVDRRVVERQR
ncbi:o-succinylbenzoate synthase [Gordonibacter sp. 28C]|uniref:o-succinylbenzoate synthase n=1 Tax=Gordonibacter sp. 28C TaxID=2078569 RepID=UPI000DF7E719|nr:o-succinylbenzoate synthase [Gordonibacter sp. 28C]RDB64426.1 o-succinylbenzoate synthase [Gordonibacter sp. 28C]